jgi:hypothetical protein
MTPADPAEARVREAQCDASRRLLGPDGAAEVVWCEASAGHAGRHCARVAVGKARGPFLCAGTFTIRWE